MKRALVLTSAAALVALLSGSAAAQLGPADAVKPLVVILLDTSGSMEYNAGDALNPGEEFTVPKCEQPSATNPTLFPVGTFPKSRLVQAKEILTGTYQDYWCQYDYRDTLPLEEDYQYPIPHTKACGYDALNPYAGCKEPVQNFNGLLDIRRDDFKFALLSMDSREHPSTGPTGMYSYGSLSSAGINLGIRNETWGSPDVPNKWELGAWTVTDADRSINNRGQLIVPPKDDDFTRSRASNRFAQYEINSLVGYWGTALAPALVDTKEFLLSDEAVRPFNTADRTGDPYSNCRDRVVIVITDGRATQGEGVGGYPTTPAAISALKNTPPNNVRVYVIGFNLADQDVSILQDLDPDNGGPADDVFVADSPADLAVALSNIFGKLLADPRSRTMVTYTNATQSNTDLQYQINTAFSPDPGNPLNQIGYVNQSIYRCDAQCANVASTGESCVRATVAVHERLQTNTTRKLFFAIQGRTKPLTNSINKMANSKADMLSLFNVPQTGLLPTLDATVTTDTDPVTGQVYNVIDPSYAENSLGSADLLDTQIEYMERLVKFLRADDLTARGHAKMGAVTHATPVVSEPAMPGKYPLRSWNVWATEKDPVSNYTPQCRPTVMYTGSHDGFIHAFRIDRLESKPQQCLTSAVTLQSEAKMGEELWAIMPQHLLKRAHGLVTAPTTLMDGQLYVADVLLSRGNPLDPLNTPEVEARGWHSVLTAGYGQGGYGYMALDVTNPARIAHVDFLWEVSKDDRCRGGACLTELDDEINDFGKFGLTTARPAYGTAFIAGKEVAIGFLPGGDSDDDPSRPYAGKVVYIVRLDNGAKLAEFSEEEGNVFNLSGGAETLDFPFTSSVSAYPDVPGVVTTRAFVGDSGGRLWRIDMSLANPSDWFMQLFFDPYAVSGPIPAADPADRQPVMGAPKLALDGPFGHVAVIYGTGALDYLASDVDARAGVFSVSEVTSSSGSVTRTHNWSKVFDRGEKLTGEPEVFNKKTFFTTFVENLDDACDGGTGRLYGVDYTKPDPAADATDNSTAALDPDGDPSTLDLVKYISTGAAIPYGVQVIERPSCFPGGLANGTSSAGAGGAVKRGALELVVNVAHGEYSSASTVAPGANTSKLTTKTFTHALNEQTETLQSAAWGNVLY